MRKLPQFKKMLQMLQVCKFNAAGEAHAVVRINDISRNYGGRHFCLRLSAVDKGLTTAFVDTTPVNVVSKYPKRKRLLKDESYASRSSPTHLPELKRCRTEVNNVDGALADWAQRACGLLKRLEKSFFGCGASGGIITKCPACSMFGDLRSLQHAKSCALAGLVEEFKQNVNGQLVEEDEIVRRSGVWEPESHSQCDSNFHVCVSRARIHWS